MLQKGDQAPDFELLSDGGELVRLSDFRGKRVVLFFYPRANTPGCTRQACGFRDNYAVVTQANGVVLGISPDLPEALAKWKEAQGFPYLLLSDPSHEVAEKYGVWGERKLYGRSFMGIIRSHFIIDEDGKIVDVQYKVSPQKSVERAVKFLESVA
ncbi:MAG: thioredoxin-dependent thiol peroxidase [Chloroflexi bacterium]|nr:MAG: thioredoxin-dependent thiol peroxidase [Chloroflexota bacterium]